MSYWSHKHHEKSTLILELALKTLNYKFQGKYNKSTYVKLRLRFDIHLTLTWHSHHVPRHDPDTLMFAWHNPDTTLTRPDSRLTIIWPQDNHLKFPLISSCSSNKLSGGGGWWLGKPNTNIISGPSHLTLSLTITLLELDQMSHWHNK